MTLAPVITNESSVRSEEPITKKMRIGMIGLDTSHAPAFTILFNDPTQQGDLANMDIVAAFPGGSQDIESSRTRVEGFTKQLREMGVEIVSSVDELVSKVDAVLVESVDGRPHLEQALPAFRAGKPVFIDKPLAGSLADCIAIDLLARKYNARWFSSSSLRFSQATIRFREDESLRSQIKGANTWGPCSLEATHPDLFWYGVHGVEMLYTVMGTGCQQVTRISTPGTDFVAGLWDDDRVGTFRGIRDGKADYGLVVFGEKAIDISGKYDGYAPLVQRIAKFFAGGEAPVSNSETIELFAFMQAADISKQNGGAPVKLSDVMAEATKAAEKRIAKLDP